MASNNPSSSAADRGVVLQAPTIPGTRTGGGSTESSSTDQFAGIVNPEAFAILLDFIKQTAGGGTEEQRRQRAERNTEIARTRALGGDYSKTAAFADAASLMAQNLRKSLEANMPAISKGIQGAGTSASSMQALLGQKLATESAQAASALGADQAKAYGGISANLQGVLEALTRIDPSIEANLLKALDLTRVQTSTQRGSRVTEPVKEVGQGGGGSYFQPFQQDQGFAGYGGNNKNQTVTGQPISPGQGYIINNRTGQGTQFNGSDMTDFFLPSAQRPLIEDDYSQNFGELGWGYGD